MQPSSKRLRELFSYTPETGDLVRIRGRIDMLGSTGHSKDVWVDGKKYVKTHVIWAIHTGTWPIAPIIDHRDGDQTNNRWDNLRAATHQQNQHNKVGFGKYPKGVVFKKDANRSKPWAARIRLRDGYKQPLGHFATMEEAAAAYEAAAAKIQGEFALHNATLERR